MLEKILLTWTMLALLYVVINGKIIHKSIPFIMFIISFLFIAISEKDYIDMNEVLKNGFDILNLMYFMILNIIVYKILRKKFLKDLNKDNKTS
jgi:hypothetical protein